MKLRIEGDRIVGYGSFGTTNPQSTYIDYTWIDPPETLKDEYGRWIYRWDGNDPVLDPIAPSDGEKNNLTDKRLIVELFGLLRTSIKQDQTWAEFKTAAIDRWNEIKATL
jgi:hypothetical protein